MKRIMASVFVSVGLILSSCNQQNDKAAEAYCACLENVNKIEAIRKENKENHDTYTEEEISKSLQEMDKAFDDMRNCIEKVKDQYKDLVSEDAVKKNVLEKCPTTYKVIYPEK